MPKIVSYNMYTTKQTFDTQEQMFGIYRLMECNAKRNRPYFFDAPIRIILLSSFGISCCCGLDFPSLRVRKIRNSLLRKLAWRLWKAGAWAGARLWRASRRRRNSPLCRRPASNFASDGVLPLDLGKVTFVTFGQDFGKKGTVFELFSCVLGKPRHTISPVESVIRV